MNPAIYPTAAGHDLAYVSQNAANPWFKAVCQCGWKGPWVDLQDWAFQDHRIHANPIHYPLPDRQPLAA